MKCAEFNSQVETWMDGGRTAEAAAHVAGCERCRTLVSELEAIRLAARETPENSPEPPAGLWANIRSQLEAEGLVRKRSWWHGLEMLIPLVPRPALAGSFLALLLVTALWSAMSNQPHFGTAVTGSEHGSIVTVRNKVDQAERGAITTMAVHDAMVAESYRENLAIVDKAIALCEKAVREQPRNELAREYLYGALQQKAELVATMMERSSTGE